MVWRGWRLQSALYLEVLLWAALRTLQKVRSLGARFWHVARLLLTMCRAPTDPPIPASNPTTDPPSTASSKADSPATGGFARWASPSADALPARAPPPTRLPPPAPPFKVSRRRGSFPLPAKPPPLGARPSTPASAASTRHPHPPSRLPPVLPPVPSVQVKLTMADMMSNVVTTESGRPPCKRELPAWVFKKEGPKRQKDVNGIKNASPIASTSPLPPTQPSSPLMVDQSTQTDAVWHFSAPREPYPPGEGFAEALEALKKLAKRREGA